MQYLQNLAVKTKGEIIEEKLSQNEGKFINSASSAFPLDIQGANKEFDSGQGDDFLVNLLFVTYIDFACTF